jgi:hypothetical protein
MAIPLKNNNVVWSDQRVRDTNNEYWWKCVWNEHYPRKEAMQEWIKSQPKYRVLCSDA